jgi:small ubiquitin-related modifier
MEEPAANQQISFKIVGQTGEKVNFVIKTTTRLEKAFIRYCKLKGHPLKTVRFLFDGKRLDGNETDKQLGIEDDDEIDAMVQQVGGSTTSVSSDLLLQEGASSLSPLRNLSAASPEFMATISMLS